MPPKSKKGSEKAVKPSKGSAKGAAAEEESTDSPADQLRKEGVITTFALSSKRLHRNVRDINVTNLTVTFHGNPLIEEAELTLNYGNRYGFMGRNGCGKSTFMRVIAARSFPIPDGIDIFHLKEEIEATDMTAKEAVMSVDRERAILEAEAEE
jgi:ATP-binding cassette subfamily F protein 2